MEIPQDIKILYSHWTYHIKLPEKKLLGVDLNANLQKEILDFANERMKVWERKLKGNVILTDNLVLQKYRFCNIYRELDRETIEIHRLLNPLKNNFNIWLLNLLFCRMVCKIDTIKKVGTLSFEDENNKQVYKKLRSLPIPKYGAAYIFPISLIIKSKYPTREDFFCFYLPETIKEISEIIKEFDDMSVSEALNIILPAFGFNFRFHFTEVLIDIAYQFPNLINLFKEFPIGPGSLPTMKRLNPNTNSNAVCLAFVDKQPFENFQYLTFNGGKIYLSAENIEGIGCEFRKYTNLKNGVGRKRYYR